MGLHQGWVWVSSGVARHPLGLLVHIGQTSLLPSFRTAVDCLELRAPGEVGLHPETQKVLEQTQVQPQLHSSAVLDESSLVLEVSAQRINARNAAWSPDLRRTRRLVLCGASFQSIHCEAVNPVQEVHSMPLWKPLLPSIARLQFREIGWAG